MICKKTPQPLVLIQAENKILTLHEAPEGKESVVYGKSEVNELAVKKGRATDEEIARQIRFIFWEYKEGVVS